MANKRLMSLVASLALALPAAAYQVPAAPNAVADENVQLLQKISLGVSSIAKEASNAIVFVSVYKNVQGMPMGMVDPFEYFFGPRGRGGPAPDPRDPRGAPPPQRREGGLGSGFFIDLKQGYILTNNHVVSDADEIQVKLANGETHEAKIVGRDPNTDVAVVKVKKDDFSREGLSQLSLGNSDRVAVGDFVIALGAPFGLEASLSFGIVSAIGRGNLDITRLGNFIQTDAAINPGNSGGPLVDMRGQVIGVNTAIYSRSGGYNGIGFAVPSNLVRNIAEQLVNEGYIRRGYLGVLLQPIDEELEKGLNLPTGVKGGALVARVVDGSPASKAGLEAGDVITDVNGQRMKEHSAIVNTIGLMKPGTKVELKYYRDGKQKVANVTIDQHPDDAKGAVAVKGGGSGDVEADGFGMAVAPLSSGLRAQYRLESKSGVVVTDIQGDSPADRSGLRPGDCILKVDGKKVETADDFKRLTKGKSRVLVWIERAGEFYFVTLRAG
jgi:serine protease Do